MSLVDNRSENNDFSPADRLSPEKLGGEEKFREALSNYFIEKDYQSWQKVDTRAIWCKYDDQKLKAFHMAFANAVLTRTANIYRAFYHLFEIGEEG